MHLADLLVAAALFGVVAAAVLTVLQEGLQSYTIGASRAESQQSGRVALERLAGEIRAAALGRRPATFAAISVAEPTRIVLHSDLDGDGVIIGAGETITWHLAGKTLRRDAGGGAQPIIDGVRSFSLEYLDALGRTRLDASRHPHRHHHARNRERFRRAAGAGHGLLDARAVAQSLKSASAIFFIPMSDISSDIGSTLMTLMSDLRRPGAGGGDRAGWIR